jgi:chemotaxis signal transduction protein
VEQQAEANNTLAGSSSPAGAATRVVDTVALSDADASLSRAAQPAPADYLLFACAGAACAVRLSALREVLPSCPSAVRLPESPEWLLGVFALRAELFGLVDPAPLLLPGAGATRALDPAGALLVGTGEQTLAWLVTEVGAIATARDDELLPPGEPGGADGAGETPPIARPYLTGWLVASGSGRRHAVIEAEALLNDLLRALERRAGAHG